MRHIFLQLTREVTVKVHGELADLRRAADSGLVVVASATFENAIRLIGMGGMGGMRGNRGGVTNAVGSNVAAVATTTWRAAANAAALARHLQSLGLARALNAVGRIVVPRRRMRRDLRHRVIG